MRRELCGYGEQIVSILKEKKMTRGELSEKSGVPYRTLLRYLNGESKPKRETTETLAKALGVDARELIAISKSDYDYVWRVINRYVDGLTMDERMDLIKLLSERGDAK